MNHARAFRLVEDQECRFFLHITRCVDVKAMAEAMAVKAEDHHHNLTVSLDPGLRTFQTASPTPTVSPCKLESAWASSCRECSGM